MIFYRFRWLLTKNYTSSILRRALFTYNYIHHFVPSQVNLTQRHMFNSHTEAQRPQSEAQRTYKFFVYGSINITTCEGQGAEAGDGR